MGQSSSTTGVLSDPVFRHIFPVTTYSFQSSPISKPNDDVGPVCDYTADLPDECLELIFQRLGSGDRTRCSIVCKRWLRVDGQSRHRLALNVSGEILPFLPSFFDRFDSVTKLALRCDRKSISISDDTLMMFSVRYRNLTSVKLRGCRGTTDSGMEMFAKNCKGLKKLSCSSCMFGSEAINAVLENCTALEELNLKRLRGIQRFSGLIGVGDVPSSLKIVCLKDLACGQCLTPLLIRAKQLKTLKVIRCLGDWDSVLQLVGEENKGLNEIHLERIHVSDLGLKAISKFSNLEALRIIKTSCADFGIISVSQGCKLLKKLHIDGWRTNMITDVGLTALGTSSNLQELVLIGINPSFMSLTAIASNCKKLERLAICGSDTVRDAEMACIAANCALLKKLCIKGCQISDVGIKALAWGCPNLSKVKVKKCRGVSGKVAEWLQERRKPLSVDIDDGEMEPSDVPNEISGAPDRGMECHNVVGHPTIANAASNSNGPLSTTTFGLLACRNILPCAFRGWPNSDNGSNGNVARIKNTNNFVRQLMIFENLCFGIQMLLLAE